MKALRITNCSDTMMWYRDHIGCIVPLLRECRDEYVSREPAGYTNIVRKTDCVIVEADPTDIMYLRAGEY